MQAQPDERRIAQYEDDFLPAAVFKLARDLRTAVDRELAPWGVTTQQAALMLVARREGGGRAGRLAIPVGTDTAGLTRLLDRLEAKGLVAREASPSDRRTVAIRLTAAGQALAPELVAGFKRVQAKLLDGVSELEAERLRAAIGRLRRNLGDHPAEEGRRPC